MFGIRDREAGNVIDKGFYTREEAEEVIRNYEKDDRENGEYEPDFYEVFELPKRAWIENQYGEKVAKLRIKGEDEFSISEDNWLSLLPAFLCEGDSWTVKVER